MTETCWIFLMGVQHNVQVDFDFCSWRRKAVKGVTWLVRGGERFLGSGNLFGEGDRGCWVDGLDRDEIVEVKK